MSELLNIILAFLATPTVTVTIPLGVWLALGFFVAFWKIRVSRRR